MSVDNKSIPHDDADDDEYYEMYYTEEEPEVFPDPHIKCPAEQDNWF